MCSFIIFLYNFRWLGDNIWRHNKSSLDREWFSGCCLFGYTKWRRSSC